MKKGFKFKFGIILKKFFNKIIISKIRDVCNVKKYRNENFSIFLNGI